MTAAVSAATRDEVAALWKTLRTTKPGIRARDAAQELGVTEAELVASGIGDTATPIGGSPADLLRALCDVGRCMALTRNEHAVSEVRGRYGGIDIGAHAGQVIGEKIDLRVFLDHWRNMFAIDEAHPQRAGERRKSIHIFDRAGVAVHKVYLEPDGDAAAWDAMVAARAVAQPAAVEPPQPRRAERPDPEIDRASLVAGWDAMTDTHEFFHLLAKHGATRTQALRLAGPSRARAVAGDSFERMLHSAAASSDRIMIFVGNRGCIQVFSGAVQRIVRHGPWINVLDSEFNLHLRTDRIASSWVVAKPTRAGIVSSLEVYDADGENIALMFRKRDDRERAEDPSWQAMLARLTDLTAETPT